MKKNRVELELGKKGVAKLLLNDPDCLNAMGEEMAEEFATRVIQLKKEKQVRVVLLTGQGRAFSSGGKLEMLEAKHQLSEDENRKEMELFYSQFLSLRNLSVPTIAVINGHAMGAAFCLALACDFRIAVEHAKLGLNFTKLGLHPGMGASYFVPKLAGSAVARELLYFGRVLTASEAKQYGLVHRVESEDAIDARVQEFVEDVLMVGPQAVSELKQSFIAQESGDLEAALQREARFQAKDYVSGEFLEGVQAAREKRKPNFVE